MLPERKTTSKHLVNCCLFSQISFCRDQIEDPLDDQGMVSQQLEQVSDKAGVKALSIRLEALPFNALLYA